MCIFLLVSHFTSPTGDRVCDLKHLPDELTIVSALGALVWHLKDGGMEGQGLQHVYMSHMMCVYVCVCVLCKRVGHHEHTSNKAAVAHVLCMMPNTCAA